MVAGFVDSTVKDIDQRLAELREEVQKLEAARSALTSGGGGSGRRAGRARSARTRGGGASGSGSAPRRSGRPRGRRGGNTRGKEALELVRKRPGITIPEIAAELKILPNYLYRVMPKLVEDGSVRKEGQGWHPA